MLDKLNKFLKDFADKWYLFIIFAVVFAAWLVFKNDFLAQLSRDLVMAMLAIAGYKRSMGETTNVNAATVKTPAINTQNVTADEISLEKESS